MLNNKCLILSLDGGGVRGLISSYILNAIDNQLDNKLFDKVTLITGCSTGAILAGLLISGYSISSLPDFYKRLIPKVFNKGTFLEQLIRKTKLFPAFNKDILVESAYKHIGKSPFSLFNKKTLIPIYDIEKDKLEVAKNWRGKFKDCLLSDLVIASSCFPTLYSPHEIFDTSNKSYGVFMDGGIAASNPTLFAIVEALDLGYRLEDIICISIGTGCDVMSIDSNKSKYWGGLRWLNKLPFLLGSGNAECIDYVSKHLIPKLYRFQISLDNNIWGIDLSNVFATDDKEKIDSLTRLSQLYIERDQSFKEMMTNISIVL